jgi:hypothetical protein
MFILIQSRLTVKEFLRTSFKGARLESHDLLGVAPSEHMLILQYHTSNFEFSDFLPVAFSRDITSLISICLFS